MNTELPSDSNGRRVHKQIMPSFNYAHVYHEDTEEYRTERFLHNCLLDEIRVAFSRQDLRRAAVLWHCYDVMYSSPINNWDLTWRRQLGYPR